MSLNKIDKCVWKRIIYCSHFGSWNSQQPRKLNFLEKKSKSTNQRLACGFTSTHMIAEVEGLSFKDVSLRSSHSEAGDDKRWWGEKKIKMTSRNARPILFKKKNKDLYCTIQTQN